MVPGAGLEPARPYRTLAPEASASANSATRAGDLINIERSSQKLQIASAHRLLPHASNGADTLRG